MRTFALSTAFCNTMQLLTLLTLLLFAERSSSEGQKLSAKPLSILAFLPTEGKSHFMGFKPLLETLVSRGHNVTLVAPFGLDGAKRPYRHVKVEQTLGDFDMLKVAKYVNLVPTPFHLWWFGPHISETSLDKPSVANFIRSDRSSFDLVLFENFYHECFVSIGHKYGAPVVQLLPFSANSRVSQWHSNPYNPAYIPDLTSAFGSNMTFAQRTSNAVSAFFYTAVSRLVYLPRQRAVADKHFVYPGHERRPDLVDMLRNVSLTLVNSHPVLGSAVPLVPSYVHVAGMHCVPAGPLPEDLRQIMESAKEGVVYFSLGSVVKSSKMPKETVSLLLSELSKIEQTVLWKWEADDIPQLPKNVVVRKWFPQNDILGHKNCKLFITHGGVQSTTESIYHGVPMLAIPVFGDQQGNSLRAQYQGIAIQFPYFELTHEAFGSALHKLLIDPTYRENAKKSSAMFRDNPLPPLEKAVFWVEYVARHNGAKHLRTAANDLYWFQYMLLDVLLLVSFVIVLMAWMTKKMLGCVFGRCCRRGRNIASPPPAGKKTQ
ncbi:UDP-glucuronosyltransferase 2C1-like [Myzus persicae]|uniref:UDP-glucuronosyltransferase 2C1-like n=1 Tax=Myzus persicae TaxID=13164 RepID=UPI000B932ACB|nr:UDP-glucuronosyltransferase 2C1-like [Myzus persicae]